MVLDQMPSTKEFPQWKTTVRRAITSCSNRPEPCTEWVRQIETRSFAQLYDSGCFSTLDEKLTAALYLILHGEFGRRIHLKEEEFYQAHFILKGRQIHWMIYYRYTVEKCGE